MDFKLNEDHHALQKMAGDFARTQLAPYAAFWDTERHFPTEVLREAAALGMGGLVVSAALGGSNLNRLDSVIIFEQLATGCITTSAYLSIHNMVASLIDKYANENLRMRWGSKLTSMEVLASYCLTEPESGSDAAALKTTATREGDYYCVNGAKAFISGGSVSDLYACMVRTGDASYQGISCLLIEKNTPGLSFGKLEKKMGWCNQPTCMVYFENCRVPISNCIGAEGMGFKIALNALNGGRINIGACSLGGALSCLRMTQQYLQERHQFNKPLSQFQGLRFAFAEMLSEFEAARLMIYSAAQALDQHEKDAPMRCAMAKRFATEAAFKISDQAMQLHGGYGYLHDYQIERIFRDLRVHRILEGTNEIMCEIVAKATLDKEYSLD